MGQQHAQLLVRLQAARARSQAAESEFLDLLGQVHANRQASQAAFLQAQAAVGRLNQAQLHFRQSAWEVYRRYNAERGNMSQVAANLFQTEVAQVVRQGTEMKEAQLVMTRDYRYDPAQPPSPDSSPARDPHISTSVIASASSSTEQSSVAPSASPALPESPSQADSKIEDDDEEEVEQALAPLVVQAQAPAESDVEIMGRLQDAGSTPAPSDEEVISSPEGDAEAQLAQANQELAEAQRLEAELDAQIAAEAQVEAQAQVRDNQAASAPPQEEISSQPEAGDADALLAQATQLFSEARSLGAEVDAHVAAEAQVRQDLLALASQVAPQEADPVPDVVPEEAAPAQEEE